MHCIASTLKPSNLDGLENFKGQSNIALKGTSKALYYKVWYCLVGWLDCFF